MTYLWIAGVLLVGCPQATTPPTADTAPTTEPAPSLCAVEGFGREVPWDGQGPYGTHRHDVAEDFTVTLSDDTDWTLSEHWTGCESYVFLPSWVTATATGDGSLWDNQADLATLLADSPDNVHYFFVAMHADKADADAALDALSANAEQTLSDLGRRQEEWWRERVHVVKKRASALDNWIGTTLQGSIGQNGLAIDRAQRVRGLGSWADVTRVNSTAGWYDNNIRYAAKEVEFFNFEAERTTELEALDPIVVPVFTGEVISQFAELDVALPSAEEMADFDTFEIEVEMRCPDPDEIEFGNCGAWDYLAGLSVQEEDGTWTELARAITTYHRESHWFMDATPMMAHLLDGGTRRFKWEWAPYWNVQPTSTYLSLRFDNRGKGYRPATVTRVATGGPFGSAYNDGRVPLEVAIPADATKVELYTLVTGHGAGANQCAEFCNHQHEFTVGASSYLIEFPEGGNLQGCEDDGIGVQMTPNQWGTWWYGRGGWCPGQPVIPQIIDINYNVTAGQTASVSYEGLYRGDTPPDGSGDIFLNSWVVTYH